MLRVITCTMILWSAACGGAVQSEPVIAYASVRTLCTARLEAYAQKREDTQAPPTETAIAAYEATKQLCLDLRAAIRESADE
jgi:hypothetical protein